PDGALGDGEPASVRLVQAHGVVAGRAAARPRTVVVEFLLDAAAHLGPEQGRAGLLDGRGERVDALQGGLGLLGALAEWRQLAASAGARLHGAGDAAQRVSSGQPGLVGVRSASSMWAQVWSRAS